MAKLELHDVRKSYGSVEVIPGVDLAIETGEFLVLVGPSGSGKSTLLRMIAGLEDTNAGRILIDGEDITNVDPSARDLAMVFQSYALYPHMTVAQNMSFALRMRKEDPAEIERRVKAAVEMLGLGGLEQRRPGQLSGGQRQRVAMGRCIVRNPKLFLFDEPLSNLDAKLRAQTRLEIRRLHDRLGATSIFVTHDQVEAMTMADRIALLKDGRLQQIGSPQELYLEPANAFVATFMGTPEMNMFEGRLGWVGEAARLEGPQSMALPAGAARSVRLRKAPAGEITIGVRPEHFVQVAPDTAGALAVRVSSVEWLGHDIFAFGDAGGRLVSFRQSQVDADGGTLKAPQAGETVHLLPMADRWHAFGGPGGVNLLV